MTKDTEVDRSELKTPYTHKTEAETPNCHQEHGKSDKAQKTDIWTESRKIDRDLWTENRHRNKYLGKHAF